MKVLALCDVLTGHNVLVVCLLVVHLSALHAATSVPLCYECLC